MRINFYGLLRRNINEYSLHINDGHLISLSCCSHVVRFAYFVLYAHAQLKFCTCMLWPLNLREGKLCGKGLFECPKRVDPPKPLFILPSINSKRLNFRVLTFGICSLPTCG